MAADGRPVIALSPEQTQSPQQTQSPEHNLDTGVTATSGVLARLRTDLASGFLAPGDQIVQERLAERYGVSRAPLREALRLLESEGLVTHEPHRGYFVTSLSVADLHEVYRLRTLLEAEAITGAVPHLSPADIDRIEALADAIDEASGRADLASVTEANRRLHFAIFEASQMPRLIRLLGQLWDATDSYRAVYFSDPANLMRISAEHRQIIAALRANDTDAVVAAHAQHRSNSADVVGAAITREGPIEGNRARTA